jgi:hypothetical protein
MVRKPFDESPSEPMPYQLRTMSSSAVVAPGSMLMTVDFTGTVGSPLPRLNAS